jgi:hypothetical protein
VLLFAHDPQRFIPSSKIQCAHFEGTAAGQRPASEEICDGTIFEALNQAMYFILSKIAIPASGGGPQTYEIPVEVVREAIVNAVAHRDYASGASVQVTLCSDRLEVSNPGALPPALTLAQLCQPHDSVPPNPLLAEPLYLATDRESRGTGTTDMIERCRKAGLPEPEFKLAPAVRKSVRPAPAPAVRNSVPPAPAEPPIPPAELPIPLADGFLAIMRRRPQPASGPAQGEAGGQTAPPVSPHLLEFLRLLDQSGPLGNADILKHMGLKGRSNLRERVINPALAAGLIEPTIPGKPNSRLQQYRLTDKGKEFLSVE